MRRRPYVRGRTGANQQRGALLIGQWLGTRGLGQAQDAPHPEILAESTPAPASLPMFEKGRHVNGFLV